MSVAESSTSSRNGSCTVPGKGRARGRRITLSGPEPKSAPSKANDPTIAKKLPGRNYHPDRWRVYGWCEGRICFINRFKDQGEAHRLVRQLRRRYNDLPARFWYPDSPDEMASGQLCASIPIVRSSFYAGSGSRVLTDATGERRNQQFRQ